MSGVTVSTTIVQTDEFGRFRKQVMEAARRSIEDAVDLGETVAKAIAPERRGELIASIDGVVLSRNQGQIVASAPHAAPQEFGASPHNIPGSFGRGADYGFGSEPPYRAPGSGGFFHPGNPPSPYLQPAYEVVRGRLLEIMDRHYPG